MQHGKYRNVISFSVVIFCCVVLAMSAACSKSPEKATTKSKLSADEIVGLYKKDGTYSSLKIDYPLEGSLFPPELPSPTFIFSDDKSGADSWIAVFNFKDGSQIVETVKSRSWLVPADVWKTVKKKSVDIPVKVQILGVDQSSQGVVVSAGSVSFATSSDPVEAPLFYREVNLPFLDAVKDPTNIRWRFGEIGSEKAPEVILEKLPVCGNCHSFSRDGSVMGMDVDYANDKGSYALVDVKKEIVFDYGNIITWSDYKREDGQDTFGLLSQVSPDGKYAVSTVKDRSVFVPTSDLEYSQLFFPVLGILSVYSRDTKTFSALAGADDPAFVQSNPAWSPDGKYVAFTRSKAHDLQRSDNRVLLTREEAEEFLVDKKEFKFDLYRVPFNDAKGGVAEPIEGASNNGMSNYFPKYSPDGKWMVFCQAANYSLLQPDSKLYIIPAEGGEARLMKCNSSNMNSWHTWSPNGKWLVFSSKANTPYTQLFITHVDEDGNDTPPVLLERFSGEDRAANIPEFVNASADSIVSITENFLNEWSFIRAGAGCEMEAAWVDAERGYRKALEYNSQSGYAYEQLGFVLDKQGKHEEAMKSYEKALEIDPQSKNARKHLGNNPVWKKRLEEGVSSEMQNVKNNPGDDSAHFRLARALVMTRQYDKAREQYLLAFQLNSANLVAKNEAGVTCLQQNNYEEAIKHFEEILAIDPGFSPAQSNLRNVREQIRRMGSQK